MAAPVLKPDLEQDKLDFEQYKLDRMIDNARGASEFLKALGHEGRLLILCYLASGEKSVSELENLLSSRQAAVSQQLARLRLEGLVRYRREGKTIYYSIDDEKARRILDTIYDLFCGDDDPASQAF